MALHLQSDSNTDLVKKLQDFGVIKHKLVANVMKETDRKYYSNRPEPYVDRLELIGPNSVLPAPHMHAYALEKLVDFIHHDSRILDIGSDTGYMAACFARLIQERANEDLQVATGMVITVEPHERAYNFTIENILNDSSELFKGGLIKIFQGDGKKECEQFGPFDVIHIGAAVPEIPKDYLKSLNTNGRMLCPVGDTDGVQQMIQCDRTSSGEIMKKVLTSVVFDPLKYPSGDMSDCSTDDQPWTDTTDDESWTENNTLNSETAESEF